MKVKVKGKLFEGSITSIFRTITNSIVIPDNAKAMGLIIPILKFEKTSKGKWIPSLKDVELRSMYFNHLLKTGAVHPDSWLKINNLKILRNLSAFFKEPANPKMVKDTRLYRWEEGLGIIGSKPYTQEFYGQIKTPFGVMRGTAAIWTAILRMLQEKYNGIVLPLGLQSFDIMLMKNIEALPMGDKIRPYKFLDHIKKVFTPGCVRKVKIFLIEKVRGLSVIYEGGIIGNAKSGKEWRRSFSYKIPDYRATGHGPDMHFWYDGCLKKEWISTWDNDGIIGYHENGTPIRLTYKNPNLFFKIERDDISKIVYRITYMKKGYSWGDKIKPSMAGLKGIISFTVKTDIDVDLFMSKAGNVKWSNGLKVINSGKMSLWGTEVEYSIVEAEISMDLFGEFKMDNRGGVVSGRHLIHRWLVGDKEGVKVFGRRSQRRLAFLIEKSKGKADARLAVVKVEPKNEIRFLKDKIEGKHILGIGYIPKGALTITDRAGIEMPTRLGRMFLNNDGDPISIFTEYMKGIKRVVSPTGGPSGFDSLMFTAVAVPIPPILRITEDIIIIPDDVKIGRFRNGRGTLLRNPILDMGNGVSMRIRGFSWLLPKLEEIFGKGNVPRSLADVIWISPIAMSLIGGDFDGDTISLTTAIKGIDFDRAIELSKYFYKGTLKHVVSLKEEIEGKDLEEVPFNKEAIYKIAYKQCFAAMSLGYWSAMARNYELLKMKKKSLTENDYKGIQNMARLAEEHGTKFKTEMFLKKISDDLICAGYEDDPSRLKLEVYLPVMDFIWGTFLGEGESLKERIDNLLKILDDNPSNLADFFKAFLDYRKDFHKKKGS